MLNFILNREKCVRCGACIADCPRHIIHEIDGLPGIPAEEEGSCIRCQHCLAICPTGAISIFGLRPEESLPLENTPAVPTEELRQFIRGRRTIRKYRAENVEQELIDGLLADTAHAPTGGNTCDLTFNLVNDRNRLRDLLELLIEGLEDAAAGGTALTPYMESAVRAYRETGEDEIFRGAPHLLLVSGGKAAYCGEADVVIALSYFELLAQSRGLGTTWCGFLKFIFDFVPELKKPFGLAPEAPYYAMAFGLPAVRYARTVQRDRVARIRMI